jgi:hypothetical protein
MMLKKDTTERKTKLIIQNRWRKEDGVSRRRWISQLHRISDRPLQLYSVVIRIVG